MSSARRIQASRANGALSKGPTTAEGKLRCARNALKHGLRARTIVPDDENSQPSSNSCPTSSTNSNPAINAKKGLSPAWPSLIGEP
jgi:hypothetical protein